MKEARGIRHEKRHSERGRKKEEGNMARETGKRKQDERGRKKEK